MVVDGVLSPVPSHSHLDPAVLGCLLENPTGVKSSVCSGIFTPLDKALLPAVGKQSYLISGTLSGHLRGKENSG